MPDEIPGQNPPADDTNAQNNDGAAPQKSVEEQLAELTAKVEATTANSRKWEQRAKENKKAADELAALKAADATPDQRLAAAEERAAQAEARLMRTTVALETGLPANLAAMLTGDEDEMREQAKALIEFRGQTPPKGPVKPDPSQGASDRVEKPSAADEGRAEAQRRIAARQKKS